MLTREAPGIIGDVSSLASNGLRAIRTRLELLTIELKEEKAWVVRFIVVAVAAVYLLSFGTLLGILAVSLAMPETTRPAVLGAFGGFMLAAGIAAVAWIVVSAKRRTAPFKDTIATLKRDEKSLGVRPVSELDVLRQRRELVLLSCDLQRATLTRRLGRIQANPMRLAMGAVVNAAKKPMVWRLGTTAIAFAVKAYRNRSARRRGRRH